MITSKIHRAGSLHKSLSKWWVCDVYDSGKYTGYFIETSKQNAEGIFATMLATGNFDDLLRDRS